MSIFRPGMSRGEIATVAGCQVSKYLPDEMFGILDGTSVEMPEIIRISPEHGHEPRGEVSFGSELSFLEVVEEIHRRGFRSATTLELLFYATNTQSKDLPERSIIALDEEKIYQVPAETISKLRSAVSPKRVFAYLWLDENDTGKVKMVNGYKSMMFTLHYFYFAVVRQTQ